MARPKRTTERTRPAGFRDILTIANRDPNYFYRFALDVPGRLEYLKGRGYETVTKETVVGDDTVDKGSQLGSAVTLVRGTQTLVLMRIPREWYDEDQKWKQDEIDAMEETMRGGPGADYGSVQITSRK